MKIQILLDGRLLSTQAVSDELLALQPSIRDAKRLALKSAIQHREISISQSLRVTFKVLEAGKWIEA